MPHFDARNGRLNIFSADGHDAADMDMARFIMALRARGLRDTVLLSAFDRTPRRAFMPEAVWPYLYSDIVLPLPCGEDAPSAHLIAHLMHGAALTRTMRVLEIGTGSGYQTALLSLVCREVVSLERYRMLALKARRALGEIEAGAIDIRFGDGLAEHDVPPGPFDRIIVNGAMDHCPDIWMNRLAPEGAVIVPIDDGETQTILRIDEKGHRPLNGMIGAGCVSRLKQGRAIAL